MSGRNPPLCRTLILIVIQGHQTRTKQKHFYYIIKNRFIIIYSSNSAIDPYTIRAFMVKRNTFTFYNKSVGTFYYSYKIVIS